MLTLLPFDAALQSNEISWLFCENMTKP